MHSAMKYDDEYDYLRTLRDLYNPDAVGSSEVSVSAAELRSAR